MSAKPVGDLTVKDLVRFPVWEYDLASEAMPGRDETWVVPVTDLPVDSLSNRVAGVKLQFGRRKVWGLLGNISLDDPRRTREFATLSVWGGKSWFYLARYFDVGREQWGPEQLAAFLGLAYGKVFPIRYDLSPIATGHPDVIRGHIAAEPDVPLTKSQRMALLFDQ